MAKANPFRFSTKYQDDETDLVYYGYRYFTASTGRWLSYDPITEVGFRLSVLAGINQATPGRNLPVLRETAKEPNMLAFVRNNPVGTFDLLGLEAYCCCNGKRYPNKTIKSGIRFCEIKSDYGEYDHGWVEVDGFSAGFYAGESIWYGTGQVRIPDDYANRSYKKCQDVYFNPCRHNKLLLKDILMERIWKDHLHPPSYNVLFHNCWHWRNEVVDFAFDALGGHKGGKSCGYGVFE